MLIPLNHLDPHPLNANVMSPATLAKLTEHIRATGLYPPIITRPMGGPLGESRFQILDGHHRVLALRELGHAHARCEVWDVTDDQTAMLLLTLNRLHGEDDPMRRGELLALLAAHSQTEELAALLPDDTERIEGLIALARKPATKPLRDADVPPLPRVMTFFLDESTHALAVKRLREFDRDRNIAFAMSLGINRASENGNSQ